jgi:hypothetical protein
VPVFDQDGRPTKLTTIDVPESAQRTIDLRMEYVRAVDGLAVSQDAYEAVMEEVWKRINKRVDAIEPRNSPYAKKLRKRWNWTTVYRWYVRYRRLRRDSHALLHRKRIRRLNLHARLHEILEDAIDNVFLVRERGSLRDTLDCAQEKVREENESRAQSGLKLFVVLGKHRQERAVIERLDRLGILARALFGPDSFSLEFCLHLRRGLIGAADVLASGLTAGLLLLATHLAELLDDYGTLNPDTPDEVGVLALRI